MTVSLKRMHRKNGKRQDQAFGMTAEIRSKMLEALKDDTSLVGLRNKALIAMAYDTGRRRSELVSLLCDDIDYAPDGSATILVRKSKTDQDGAGMMCYLAPDTVDYIEEWLQAANIFSGHIFRSLRRGGKIMGALQDQEVPRILKEAAALARMPFEVISKISGHSGRVGMTQDMLANDFDIASIMHAGGWKTPAMVVRYGERLVATKSASARLANIQGRSRMISREMNERPA